MVRKLLVVFTSVVLFAAAHAKALGLGEIVLDSALNQPLNAQIALLQLGDVRPEQISVQIADESDFARFSIERETFLNSIEFNVQSRGANTFVQLSTAEAVREPYLSFVLETRWPSGRLLSEHTLLLDLPAFAPTGSAAPIQQPVQTRGPAQQDGQNQSLAGQSSSPTQTQPARLAAPAEPEEEEPAVVEMPAQVEEIANEPPVPVPAPEPAPNVTPRNANNDETVTIGTQDTLWDVALQIRPDSTVSVQQTMLALQSLNREAFIADNINMVRRGQVLRVPTLEQIRTLSAREAMSEVARQNQLFDNRRNVPLTAQPVTAQPQASTAAVPGRGELSVVSVDNAEPSDASSGSGTRNAEFDARIASLEDALAVQREEADRSARVNAELTARLGLLEEQISSAQEIIRLRDLELAQLQQALEVANAAEPEPVDPPTVITMAPEKTLVEQILDTLVANTYALIALIGLIIVMLVFVLLRRNRAADQAALAGIDGMEVNAGQASATELSDEDYAISEGDSSISTDLSEDELDEIMNIAGSADAELLSEDIKFDDEAEVDSNEALEEGDSDVLAEALVAAELADTQEPHAPIDLLEEVETLIAYERFDDAEAMLRDAIVAEPDRVDLRMLLLEVLVAKQDVVGFKLQETEIRDMGKPNVEPRIATLRAQLLSEIDSEILEEGEEDFFEELNELDDMELALDLEASAEVDDRKVLAGTPDAAEEDNEVMIDFEDPEEDISNDIDFEFASDEDEISPFEDSAEESEEVDEGVELSFASPEPGALIEDFDESEDDTPDLSAEFDLSDSDEETIDFEIEQSTLAAAQEDTEPVDLEVDENAIDFEFAVLDDETSAESKATSSPAAEAEVPEIEFEIDDADDAEIEFLDDDDEDDGADIDFAFDDSSFEIESEAEQAPEEQQAQSEPERAPAEDGPFDDLQFVDDSIEPANDAADEDDEDSDGDFDFLSDADESATKLDLARAYFEMGDHDGAREILEEVQKEGNEEQVKDATELLSKL